MGKMSKCSFKSLCGKLVGVGHGDDILLADLLMQYGSLYEIATRHKKQMMGPRPTDASEIVLLNRWVQWTEEGIGISPDPRHVKEIIEELSGGSKICRHLNDCEPAGQHRGMPHCKNQRVVAQVELLGNGSPRNSLRCIHHHGESRLKLERCGYGQTRESGASSVCLGDRPLERTIAGGRDQTTSCMTYTDSDWVANREDRRSMSGGMLCSSTMAGSWDSGQDY